MVSLKALGASTVLTGLLAQLSRLDGVAHLLARLNPSPTLRVSHPVASLTTLPVAL